MAEPAPKILNSIESIPEFVFPTGRKLKIIPADPKRPLEPIGLFKIVWESDGGVVPEQLQGWFTSTHRAALTIKNLLTKVWADSDKEAVRLKEKRVVKPEQVMTA